MRGGAIPLICWGLLLSVSGTLNAIWTGDTIQIATFAAAVLAVTTCCVVLIVREPSALRRGEPPPRKGPRAVVRASIGALLLGTGTGIFVLGFAFGHFPIYFGAGMMIAGVARLLFEHRAQREALRQAEHAREGGAE